MKTILRLLPYLRPCRTRFLQACVIMACVAAFNGALIRLLKHVVDDALFVKDPGALWWAAAAVPAVFFVKLVLVYTQAYLTSWIGQRGAQLLRADLFRHLHSLTLDFFWRRRSAEVLSRVTNDLNTLQDGLQFVPLYAIRDVLTLLVLVSVLFYTHWKFALIALAGGPPAALALSTLGRKMRRSGMRSQEIMGDLYHRFQESLLGMAVIKAFNYEEPAVRRFRAENADYTDQMMRYLRATALSSPIMEFLGSLILGGLVYVGGREVIAGTMTPGDFFAFMAAFFAAYDPLKNIARLNPMLQISIASAQRVFEVLDAGPTVEESPRSRAFLPPRRALTLEGVSYRYAGSERPALDGLDLELRPGEVLGVVGPSGAGKSTLALLLMRFIDPERGRILVDGEDLRGFTRRSLREQVGLVTQETTLFNGTVRENVLLGRDAADEAVWAALRAADAEAFVRQIPGGLDAALGERGAKLSGGQRQRIAIARAVLLNPPWLVLDEATSSLDSESEAAVQKALEALFKGRTAVVIAHRLSTVRSADRILVLDRGRAVESGTHAELLSRGGLYNALHELQALEA